MKVGDRFNPYKEFTGSWVSNWLLERTEISANAKLVYARLSQFAGPNGKCYPKRETIARECGMCTSSVDRAIRELKREKLIECERQGFNRPNLYYFLVHQWIIESRKVRKNVECNDLSDLTTQELSDLTNIKYNHLNRTHLLR